MNLKTLIVYHFNIWLTYLFQQYNNYLPGVIVLFTWAPLTLIFHLWKNWHSWIRKVGDGEGSRFGRCLLLVVTACPCMWMCCSCQFVQCSGSGSWTPSRLFGKEQPDHNLLCNVVTNLSRPPSQPPPTIWKIYWEVTLNMEYKSNK